MIASGKSNRTVDVKTVQKELLKQGAVLVYFKDSKTADADNAELQLKTPVNGKDVGWTKA